MGNWISSLFNPSNNYKTSDGRQITAHDRAILDLKIQRDKLKQFSKKLELVSAREKEIARQLLRDGKKNLARLCLRKKRFQEQLLERLSVQLSNLEQLVDTIEFAQIEKKVFDGLKAGNEALKQIQQEMNIEAVEELMLETQSAIQRQREIDAMLCEKLTDEDEEEIQRELEILGGDEEAVAIDLRQLSISLSSTTTGNPSAVLESRVKVKSSPPTSNQKIQDLVAVNAEDPGDKTSKETNTNSKELKEQSQTHDKTNETSEDTGNRDRQFVKDPTQSKKCANKEDAQVLPAS
jgi:charged multivesicular body protein 6